MRALDENKKYDLSHLNDEQLKSVLNWLKAKDKDWHSTDVDNFKRELDVFCLKHDCDLDWSWTSDRNNITNALELFDETDIYQRADLLMEDGKKQGLKIKISFEKM